jgi:hypothetical protein
VHRKLNYKSTSTPSTRRMVSNLAFLDIPHDDHLFALGSSTPGGGLAFWI